MTNIWMHIGIGSFQRAHQAWYLHRLLQENTREKWIVAAGGIRKDTAPLLDALSKQDGQYILETVTPKGERDYEKITSIQKILPYDDKMQGLVEQGIRPETKIIAFTVTEGGYYLDTNHQLDKSSRDIQSELKGEICTIYGALKAILKERIRKGGQPVTLLSCDNLRHNGERFRNGFIEFLKLSREDQLLEWVRKNTSSPNTMVDRITPRPSADLPERVYGVTHFRDAAPVMAESFIQWVIEDHFIDGRPELEKVGVEMVKSVDPWEEAKIRILNSSHSCVAWAGTLAGLSFIHEDVANAEIRKMAWNYVTEDVIPCLTPSPLDLARYRDVVLDRFSNPYIKDTNQRVAADSFSKIPGFITPTLTECYDRGKTPDATAVLPALFFVFLENYVKDLIPYQYQDGIMNQQAVHEMFKAGDPVAEYAGDKMLFGKLAGKPEFVKLLHNKINYLRDWQKKVNN
ncbi:D-arabinitol 4-dehydrogenase [Commensalibacter melissae]|uniref:D-arabinitol 4-dehydrogenase n=1 Tax=Commensalibacter melissae TaxID=2070537 RepID=UPI001E4E5A4F|nr:D-arabinitol 4-dehydrogenase [Commensalibacter melissae]